MPCSSPRPVHFFVLLLILLLAGFSLQKTQRKSPANVKKGQEAPDIQMTNPDGEEIALSDLRGHIVLIDFWASWCGPCRIKHPRLVRFYREFRNKEYEEAEGFTVFSVSLDKSKQNWVTAIKKDKLEWDYHASELKGWECSAAAQYGVNAIPATFLIDHDGTVIGKNAHLDDYAWELDKRIK